MNMQRGLFRLWVCFAVIFAAIILFISYDDIKNVFSKTLPYHDYQTLLPVDCSQARGNKPSTEKSLDGKSDDKADYFQLDNGQDKEHCFYTIPKFRPLYPEYKDLSDEELVERTYDKIGVKTDHFVPWEKLFHVLRFAFGIPLIILALGRSLFWVASGFKSK